MSSSSSEGGGGGLAKESRRGLCAGLVIYSPRVATDDLFIGAARAFDEIDLVHQVTMEEDGHLLTVDVGATGYGNDSG